MWGQIGDKEAGSGSDVAWEKGENSLLRFPEHHVTSAPHMIYCIYSHFVLVTNGE